MVREITQRINLMSGLKVKKFRPIWTKLKKNLTEEDLKFFYEIVDIDGTCGRVISFTTRDLNPRYMEHWFAVCRCHWNVIFPCWLLNGRSISGKYKIITSDKHSAIINTETQEVYDPTYAVRNGESSTEGMLAGYEIVDLILHSVHVDQSIFKRIVDMLSVEDRKIALDIISKHVESLKVKPDII